VPDWTSRFSGCPHTGHSDSPTTTASRLAPFRSCRQPIQPQPSPRRTTSPDMPLQARFSYRQPGPTSQANTWQAAPFPTTGQAPSCLSDPRSAMRHDAPSLPSTRPLSSARHPTVVLHRPAPYCADFPPRDMPTRAGVLRRAITARTIPAKARPRARGPQYNRSNPKGARP
jgi:hypothetical protein